MQGPPAGFDAVLDVNTTRVRTCRLALSQELRGWMWRAFCRSVFC